MFTVCVMHVHTLNVHTDGDPISDSAPPIFGDMPILAVTKVGPGICRSDILTWGTPNHPKTCRSEIKKELPTCRHPGLDLIGMFVHLS